MPGEEPRLTARQERAIVALMSRPTVKAAAKAAKVGLRTLHGWLKEDVAFQEAYREARRVAVEIGLGNLQKAAGKAARQLVKELAGEKAGDRIRAALGILNQGITAVELADVLARVAEIEQRAKEAAAQLERQAEQERGRR